MDLSEKSGEGSLNIFGLRKDIEISKMFAQLSQHGWCHSPEQGEGLVLRPEFLGQYRDSRAPFVSAGDETVV